ncbi:GNAT family N-acetyltransferase [Pontibacter toksunensis]|uniref:GNAT family N-acetyltransferase n=1 Tax=Pontibacter toksunensis TaxID=1332631 RepID=A0ABW6BPQ3_9BACT
MKNTFELLRNQNSQHPTVFALQNLYEESFPAKERRHFQQLLTLLSEPDMYFFAVVAAKEVLGLCIYWQLEGFFFLEHLAIEPSHQGCGIGRQVMQWLLARTGKKLVLEVERQEDEQSIKRIQFYQRLLGFTLHSDFDYHQPPYQKGGQPVPLYLMTAEPVAEAAELERIASHIKHRVYERFYS